ncbi:GTPase-associated protein 1-related protein [Phytohabitans flavus]|uniref:Uncharacterized protein n=1 Tax=Phytohabitans flavus TaxID=1076124 RepID=A0A6F8XXU6_9ACTN|nr:hypothetical protein Pflav_049680 [Phytohabitans flavus]
MTGQFETLIYTDCRPGQGLQGTAGFQFQARSPGVDGESMDIVRKSLLYEPPGRWMRERRPVEDYPPSLAHIHKGVFATSAGVYLGKETNGSREGNQLTHSIVTREPAAYGLVRPAQMFQAPFWRTQPAESTTCPTLDAGWEPGPFDAVRAQEFVRSQDKGADLLRALLSALQRLASGKAKARRILFVARDPVLVLRWLTAATLLMPQRSALRVGFKIFTANPAYADQQVLAVHPDWGVSEAAVDNDHGYTVFDLVRHVWSEVDSTAPARRWVALFLAEDPYDVVDAVEVTAATRLPDEAAATVAVTAVLRRKPTRAGAQVVASWLRDGPQSLVGVYGGPMLDLFVETAADWPPATLFVLDEATRRGGFTEQAARVRLSLLAAELELARTTGGVGSGRIPPPLAGGWGRRRRRRPPTRSPRPCGRPARRSSRRYCAWPGASGCPYRWPPWSRPSGASWRTGPSTPSVATGRSSGPAGRRSKGCSGASSNAGWPPTRSVCTSWATPGGRCCCAIRCGSKTALTRPPSRPRCGIWRCHTGSSSSASAWSRRCAPLTSPPRCTVLRLGSG